MTVSELYAILTLNLGIDAKYVLDEMQMYEINSLMKYSYYKHKDEWEQARLISYLIAQVNSSKKLKIDDIIKFHWEGENSSDSDKQISQEEIEMLQRQAEEYAKMFASEK